MKEIGEKLCKISTHAPARGATCVAICGELLKSDFYSRPCERGDRREAVALRYEDIISTHAPARGATSKSSASAT